MIDRIIGVTKAYTTRVGEGPFPTEDLGPDGDLLVERGAEFGATTGRKRRCGWFDAVIVRYAARVSSLTEIFLTKIDVLSARIDTSVANMASYQAKMDGKWTLATWMFGLSVKV